MKHFNRFDPMIMCLYKQLDYPPGNPYFASARHSRCLYRGFRDMGYLPFYFQGYGIFAILLPGIWDICHFTSREMGYLPFYLHGYGIVSMFSGILHITKENAFRMKDFFGFWGIRPRPPIHTGLRY